MAEWTASYINDLPDSAFAYIEPGGSKDGTGRTTPRTLRHFPIRSASGELDADHVRNALARLSQSPFGRRARAKVEAAARALGIGAPAQEADVNIAIFEAALAEAEAALVTASEAGRVFSAANEQALRAVATAINALLAQVQQAPAAVSTGAAGGAPQAPAVPTEAADPEQETVVQEAVIPLSEAAKGGKGLVKVIDAGWGASGYYTPSVLERDAPLAFPAGTKMYWDHPTLDEAKNRPERSLRDLAAMTTDPARWMKDGPEGPGVYAPVAVLAAYRPSLDELKDDIGVSIRAGAHVRDGEADGRKGPLIERLLPSPINSIDFVTTPGRGGRIAALFEAARGRNTGAGTEDDVSEGLTAAEERAARAEERAARAEAAAAVLLARSVASEVLAGVDIPDAARTVVLERVTGNPPMKNGALDADAFRAAVTEAATAEKAYIDRLTGAGQVRLMGSGSAPAQPDSDALARTFQRLGLSESAAKTAAAGRH